MRAKSLFLLIWLGLTGTLHAAVIVDNLGEVTRANTEVSNGFWAAQSFYTDGQTYALTSIVTLAGEAAGGPAVFAQLRKLDPAGAVVANFLIPSLSGPISARTLLPDTSTTLEPSTLYWLIFGVSAPPGTFLWSYAEGNAYSGPGAFDNYGYSADQGASWGAFNFENPYQIQVNGTVAAAIPEPGPLALLGSGFALLLGLMRTKRSRGRGKSPR